MAPGWRNPSNTSFSLKLCCTLPSISHKAATSLQCLQTYAASCPVCEAFAVVLCLRFASSVVLFFLFCAVEWVWVCALCSGCCTKRSWMNMDGRKSKEIPPRHTRHSPAGQLVRKMDSPTPIEAAIFGTASEPHHICLVHLHRNIRLQDHPSPDCGAVFAAAETTAIPLLQVCLPAPLPQICCPPAPYTPLASASAAKQCTAVQSLHKCHSTVP